MSDSSETLLSSPAMVGSPAAVSFHRSRSTYRSFLKRLWRWCPRIVREIPLRCLAIVLLPTRTKPISSGGDQRFIVAPLSEASGIATGARNHISRDLASGCQLKAVDLTPLFRESDPGLCPFPSISIAEARRSVGAGTVVIHANPPHFLITILSLGRKFLLGKEVVAYWVWELDDIPPLWRFALRFVDRIEVPSRFVADAISRHTDKAITVVPHPVPQGRRHARHYAEDGVTRVLFMFDIAGRISRKNPAAAVAAFASAFGGRSDVAFTIKISPSTGFEFEVERLVRQLSGIPGIALLVKRLNENEITELYRTHDIYLSLHRAEGYGLTIREAMEHGLQVVATGWSGNMDFMHGQNVHAINYRLVPVVEDQDIFAVPNAKWAEPDVGHAAEILKAIDRHGRSGL